MTRLKNFETSLRGCSSLVYVQILVALYKMGKITSKDIDKACAMVRKKHEIR